MSISQTLNNLQPRTRRIVLAGSAVVLVFGVSWLLTSMTEKKASRVPRAAKPEVTVVSPQRATGIEQFAARFDGMEKTFREMNNAFERRIATLEDGKGKKPDGAPGEDGMPTASNEPTVPPLQAGTSVFDAPPARAPLLPPPPPVAPAVPKMPGSLPSVHGQTTGSSGTAPSMPPAPAANEGARDVAPTMPTIRLLGESGEMDEQKAEQKLNTAANPTPRKKRENETAFIPGGSMFPGVLLNGMDAPTSSVSQKNPTPVLIRVKKEAVLPNFASIDVRECFVMGAGFGQLASERALIRTESIACVRNDGKVFDTKLEAYIVGTDGKVGVPGRLVSKQGQMIAQSLLAGALGGIGSSLTKSKVPALNINPGTGSNIYEEDSISSVAQSGLAGGISSATNMIAKFYLDMAKETFPVVETQAGQAVTVIVTRGMGLPLKGSTSLERYAEPTQTSRANPAKPGADQDQEQTAAFPARPTTTASAQVGASAIAPTVVGMHQVPAQSASASTSTSGTTVKPPSKAQW